MGYIFLGISFIIFLTPICFAIYYRSKFLKSIELIDNYETRLSNLERTSDSRYFKLKKESENEIQELKKDVKKLSMFRNCAEKNYKEYKHKYEELYSERKNLLEKKARDKEQIDRLKNTRDNLKKQIRGKTSFKAI